MLDRSSWLTCELNFMQYPEGPPINVLSGLIKGKHHYLKKFMHSHD